MRHKSPIERHLQHRTIRNSLNTLEIALDHITLRIYICHNQYLDVVGGGGGGGGGGGRDREALSANQLFRFYFFVPVIRRRAVSMWSSLQ
jgi:hypothetical protein